ncbi:MAG: lactonase family protein [Coprobacillaceae bacterium]
MGFMDSLLGMGKKKNTKSFFVNSYGNEQTRGIYTFKIDVDSGELIFRKYFKTPTDPSYSFNYGRFVCTTYKNRTGSPSDGGICSYTSTAETLALVSRISDGGKTYVHACTNGDDEVADKVFAVDYYNGQVMVGAIEKKKLKRVLSTFTIEGSSVHPTRQTIPHPSYVGFTPDEKLYVVDLGIDKVLLFDVSDEGELIIDEKSSLSLPAGSGPRKMIFSKNGKFAYVLNELTNTIMVYAYENSTFTLVQTIDTYDKVAYPDEESLAGQFVFSEDEKFAFVSNRGHDSVSSFSVNNETGELTYRDFVDTSFNPIDLYIVNNRWIVIACQKGGNVEVAEYLPEKDGLLYETKYSYLVSEPICITGFVDIMERKQ